MYCIAEHKLYVALLFALFGNNTGGTLKSNIYIYISIYIKLKSCLSVCLSDGHAAYSPDLARIDIVCADNEALIICLL